MNYVRNKGKAVLSPLPVNSCLFIVEQAALSYSPKWILFCTIKVFVIKMEM